MKKIISLVLSLLLFTSLFSSCSSQKKSERNLYNVKLAKYINVATYKGLTVKKTNKDYLAKYDEIISEDIKNNDLFVKKTEGEIASGDKANIDYIGKKDGVAFEGGSANGYNLTVGSGTFIPGFEDGLIGKKIGSTVDLNLTFPEDYGNTELAGKAVVFTVKINYVTTSEELKPADYFSELGFKSEKEYIEDAEKRAVQNFLIEVITEKSKVKDYPEKDLNTLTDNYMDMMEKSVNGQFGISLEEYLQYSGQTLDDFKKEMTKSQVKPEMKEQMVLYYILDKENMSVDKKDVEKQINAEYKKYSENPNITPEAIKNYYGEIYFEYLAVKEKVLDFIFDNAVIK